MFFLIVYTGLGYFIRTAHINLIHKVWVDLIKEGSKRLTVCWIKKANSME